MPLLASALVIAADPVGLQAVTDRRSAESFQRISAPFYPDTARDLITLVLIDDATVRSGAMQWTPTFGQYRQLLLDIGQNAPRAVFLDTLLLDKRGDPGELQSFAELVGEFEDAGIPVFLASPQRVVDHDPTRGDAAAHKCEDAGFDLVGALGDKAQPFVLFEGFDGDYPLYGYNPCLKRQVASPALDMYRLACDAGLVECGNSFAPDGGGPQARFGDAMSVRWAEGTSLINLEIYGHQPGTSAEGRGCRVDDRNSLLRSLVALGGAFFGALVDGPADVCLYHPHVPAWMVIKAQDALRASGGGALQDVQRIQESLFSGKFVIIGSNLRGLPDQAEAPTLGLVPGAAMHAMALDNLLTYGTDYQRPPPALVLGLDLADVIELAILAVFAVWSVLFPPRTRVSFAWTAAGAVVLVAAVETLFVAYGHFQAMNWLGVTLAVLGFNAVNAWDVVKEELKGKSVHGGE